MSTRKAEAGAPLSHERYMSSPEFSDLRAISGTAVAKRCALVSSPAKRELIWFIQGLSLAEAGLKRLAKELLAMFPERLGTPTMHKLGTQPSKAVSWESAVAIYSELGVLDLDDPEPSPRRPVPMKNLLSLCSKVAAESHVLLDYDQRNRTRELSIEEFLIDLCINPRMQFKPEGQGQTHDFADETDIERTREEFPELEWREFRPAKLAYFRDIAGALVEYKRRYEERVRAEFCHTAISRQIWKQLDDFYRMGTMGLVDGLEGRGKSEAVRAWCQCHLGIARFITLKGTSTKTTQFRAFAQALGVGHGYTRKVSEMQAQVEDVLRVSKLMPVIDEAHFFFNQGARIYTRPELLDWIDTALCNPPLPVALITTPQFLECVEKAASPRVGWNYRQFKRRCKRYWRLPAKNTPEDIEAVTRHLLPGADRATIKLVMGYEALSKRDLSAVGDVAREAKLLAEQEGAAKLTFEHVKRAIHEVLLVSDLPWAEMEKRLRHQKPGRKALPQAPAPAPELSQEQAESAELENTPRLSTDGPSANRIRFHESEPEVAGTQG